MTYAEEGHSGGAGPGKDLRLGSVPIVDSLLQTNGLVRHNADRLARLVLGLARVNRQIEANGGPLRKMQRKIKKKVAATLFSCFSLGIKAEFVFKEDLKGRPIPYEDCCTEGKEEPAHEVLTSSDPLAGVSPDEDKLEFSSPRAPSERGISVVTGGSQFTTAGTSYSLSRGDPVTGGSCQAGSNLPRLID